MKAKAPGKIVLSGAYAVLDGAPAIVSAVDRYVICDPARPAERVTPEVRAALPSGPFPAFDAAALWDGGRKLGLGSSAAILVASLAAVHGSASSAVPEDSVLQRAIEATALRAHREAQGGGSGIDVAASTRGGTLVAIRSAPDVLQLESVALPAGLLVEAWASSVSASTPELLAAVRRFESQQPQSYRALLDALTVAARAAVTALIASRPEALIEALSTQRELLARLGTGAGVPIVTPEVERLAAWAKGRAAVLPSGAGGGDIVLWVATEPSPPAFRELAASLAHRYIPLQLHARGAFCFDRESRVVSGS